MLLEAEVEAGIRTEHCPKCALCGAEGEIVFRGMRDVLYSVPGEYEIWRCRGGDCGLMWMNPRPVDADVGKLYADYFTHPAAAAATQMTSAFPTLAHTIRGGILQAAFGYDSNGNAVGRGLGRIVSAFAPMRDRAASYVMFLERTAGGRLLDVGCGNGGFLLRMKELGWTVTGVEPDPVSSQYARERGLKVVTGRVQIAELDVESFDAITMVHVAEHLTDPLGTFGRCHDLLKPGGRLVVVTPNAIGRGSRIFGKSWLGWDVPRHLFHFSPKTLGACAAKAGLKVARTGSLRRMTREIYSKSFMIRRSGRAPHRGKCDLSFGERIAVNLQSAIASLTSSTSDQGEEAFVIATKTA